MASKKKHEEILKQINIKEEFADKVYKKMRADRYGLTFCCPNDLQDINIKNYACDWQNIAYDAMPEAYVKNYTRSPVQNYCAPPGSFNAVTGLCDAQAEQTLVGVTDFTLSDSIPNGTANAATSANYYRYGIDCPIIFSTVNLDGTGSVPTMLSNTANAWWRTYNATPTGPEYNASNPNVTEISFVNALGKRPIAGWPTNEVYEWATTVTVTAAMGSTMYHVALCAEEKFYFSSTTGGVTTDHISTGAFNATSILQMIQQADPNLSGLTTPITIPNIVSEYGHDAVTSCHQGLISEGSNVFVPTSRMWIYPLELAVGCHTITMKGDNKNGNGMVAAVVFQNTLAEIVAADERSDLTEIFASDTQNALYQNINITTPWTCQSPALPISTTPYSVDCPGCRTESSTMVLQCPEGYSFNENTQQCEGTFSTCNTETLIFEVVNQNGDVMPNYDITFDGGSYTTDIEGNLQIVIENASVDTDHMFNLCHCITTGGGCAIQKIKITVTDSNAVICTPVDEVCPCKAPALLSVVMPSLLDSPQVAILTFQDLNLANTLNTISSYSFEYRVYTSTGDGDWTTQIITKPSSGTTFTVNFSISAQVDYEYRIKTTCTKTESNYSAIYPIEIVSITNPADLIAWWDFTDVDNMFTDLAANTKVSASSDPVRRINNKATDTKKLGIFLRSVETLGWTGVSTTPPKFNLGGTNGYSFVEFSTAAGTDASPLFGSATAGYGGVTDGSAFSNLTNFSNQDYTIIKIIGATNSTLTNPTLTQNMISLGGIKASSGTLGNFVSAFSNVAGNKFAIDSIGTSGATPNLTMQLGKPQQEGFHMFVNRTSSVNLQNQFSRNAVTADEETTYNEINLFGVPTLDTFNFNTGTNVNVTLGATVFESLDMGTAAYKGQLYEVLVYNKTLTDEQLVSVTQFLRTKYGII
tara:strand:+ start:5189 stop:7966 length:2778 start_codon:yes stop_codon:yes gene_type:complete